MYDLIIQFAKPSILLAEFSFKPYILNFILNYFSVYFFENIFEPAVWIFESLFSFGNIFINKSVIITVYAP